MWMYLPVQQTSTQKFISVQTSDSYHLVEDQLGNQKMVFELRDIAPYGSKIISVNLRVNMSDLPNRVSVNDLTPYLEGEKHIESDDAAIVALAAELRRNSEVSTIEAIYHWALQNMTYEGYVAEDRGALYALEHGEGDCTEYAHLVTALARAA
ncbi:MAG: transglutaminase domain-containing protein, partial [Gammaproteobacteria bacterium]|nr:transglutaminase domain-containing protein [Gammaproteobacteria bacterium]